MILSFIIKPTHLCNFSCKYCYNEDERKEIMDESTLENIMINSFDYAESKDNIDRIEFIWHGGEPLIVGREFFNKALHYQEKYAKEIKYKNSIQTNGYLLDDNWLEFILENDFLLSISIDGPKEINDKTRKCDQDPNFFSVIENNLLAAKNKGIETGICSVISKKNVFDLKDVFNYFESLGINYNMIPIALSGEAKNNQDELSISPKEYGSAWCEMFDLWLDTNSKLVCSDFLFKIKSVMKDMPLDCIGSKNCSLHNFSLDEHGNVFPCATLSGDSSMMYGNINDESLVSITERNRFQTIVNREIHDDCLKCHWKNICNSGCFARAYRHNEVLNKSKDPYCEGLKMIYSHVENKLSQLVGGEI